MSHFARLLQPTVLLIVLGFSPIPLRAGPTFLIERLDSFGGPKYTGGVLVVSPGSEPDFFGRVYVDPLPISPVAFPHYASLGLDYVSGVRMTFMTGDNWDFGAEGKEFGLTRGNSSLDSRLDAKIRSPQPKFGTGLYDIVYSVFYATSSGAAFPSDTPITQNVGRLEIRNTVPEINTTRATSATALLIMGILAIRSVLLQARISDERH